MRAMTRTVALAFVLLGLASAPLAAQANPPPPSNPPGAQPTGPQYQGPLPQAPQAQSPQPQGPQYSSNEIVDAGHRFFGTISRELAQIVEKAGSLFGLPNGYVLGQEGGGAVVAGLRYGEGILYTKNAGDLRVFWQGPSLGYDFGVDGARTMMLVYNLPATDAIYQRFAGIEGSAYFVGADNERHRRGPDPHGGGDTAGREYRLSQIHADGDLEPVLNAGWNGCG